MKISDPIADMLTRIRNAGMIHQPEVAMPSSKMKVAIAGVLRDTGYIRDFRVEGESKPTLTLELKYMGDRRHRQPVIEGIERVSKPSARTYVGSQEMPRSLGGLGVVILSTPQGVMSDRQAKAANVGGEVLCRVW